MNLLKNVDMLEATHKVTLEAKNIKSWILKQKVDEMNDTIKFYIGVVGGMERETIDLKL